MLKILFVTSATHTPDYKNLNHFQRVYFLSRNAELTILAGRDADFTVSAAEGTRVIRASRAGKAGLFMHALRSAFSGAGRKYDIVLTEPSVLAMSGYFFKLLGGCKWVVDVWDIPIRCHMGHSRAVKVRCALQRMVLKRMFKKADLFILSILPDFEFKRFNIPPEKVLALKNAIWPVEPKTPAAKPPQPFTILCMRSVHTFDMGLDVLARAFALLKQRLPEAELVIVGEIPYDIRSQLGPVEGMPGVRLTGYIAYGELQRAMREAAVFVVPFKDVPDLAQTYPIKIIEYMAEGKPIVASDIEGTSRMIKHGENGLLFRAGDHRDLAEKLLKLAGDEDLYAGLTRAGVRHNPEFDCETKNKLIMRGLQELAGRT
ncbi:MAG: glycosyltransferase family 4 protein [Thermodesulfobacteriota bacterium]|nr:glycosyltransferase family 4 protein [Thermodesulfobacteriota bacterium]